MRIAIFATCPIGVYSGGRYHALIAGYCLARLGHEVYFITNAKPIFDSDLTIISPGNPVKIVETNNFEVTSKHIFDHVIIAPQISRIRRLYVNAIRFAKRSQAALSFFCYESGNWFNAVSDKKRAIAGWCEWFLPTSKGALVLCSAKESEIYARDFFVDVHPNTSFGIWQPAINSVARDAAPQALGAESILLFARPSDPHKGADIVEQLLVPETRPYPFVIVIGNARGAEQYCETLQRIAKRSGHDISFRFALSDVEKFSELKRARALVFPSQFEGYGYPPIEALATDTHCVAYDLPVIRENCGDLVGYVPKGDVAALRDKLIEVMQSGHRQETSGLEQVNRLSDIDIRARALEETLKAYSAECMLRHTPSQTMIEKAKISVSEPEIIQGKGFRLCSMVIAAPYAISATSVQLQDGSTVPCHTSELHCASGIINHQLVVDLSDRDYDSKTWPGGTAFVTLRGRSAFRIELEPHEATRHVIEDTDSSSFGINQIYRSTAEQQVFGWALPDCDYDSALLIKKQGEDLLCVPGSVGLVNGDYKKKTGVSEKADCGLSFTVSQADPLKGSLTIVLFRNGRAVASSAISEGQLRRASPMEIIELHTPSGNDPAAEAQAAARSIYRSRATVSRDRAQFSCWTDAFDHPTELLVRRYDGERPDQGAGAKVLLHVRPNQVRMDVAEERDLERGDFGFFCVLPPVEDTNGYALELRNGGERLARIARLRLDGDVDSTLHLQARSFRPYFPFVHNDDSVFVVSRPQKLAVTEFSYDARAKALALKGWVLEKENTRIAVLDAVTHEVIKDGVELTERPDIARKYGDEFLISGISVSVPIRSVAPGGYVMKFDRSVEAIPLPAPTLSNVEEFKINDCRLDAIRRTIWARGTFVCQGTRATAIEFWQNGNFLCTGVVNVKQSRLGDPRAGWRVESVVEADFRFDEPVQIRIMTDCGISLTKIVELESLGAPGS